MFSKLLYCVNPKAKIGERLCVRAAEAINKGELLLVDKAYVACHKIANATKLPDPIHPDALFCADRTCEEALYLQLLKHDKIITYAQICGVEEYTYDALRIITNSMFKTILFGMEIEYGAALYEKMVYFNHSCAANAQYAFGKHQSIYVTAKCDIAKGEEVCVAYKEFPKGDCAAHYPMEVLGFTCSCDACFEVLHGDNKENLKPNLKVPSVFFNESFTVDVHGKLVVQAFRQLMQTFNDDATNYRKQYKLARLLMQQKHAWRKFCATTDGVIIVFMGLKVGVAALLYFKQTTSEDFEDLYLFWNEWNQLLTTTHYGDHAPPSYRYGILLHTLLAKFFRIVKKRSEVDFQRVYIRLVQYMSSELYVHQQDFAQQMLCLHLDILGWIPVMLYVQKWHQLSLQQ